MALRYACEDCDKTFETEHGAKTHRARMHKKPSVKKRATEKASGSSTSPEAPRSEASGPITEAEPTAYGFPRTDWYEISLTREQLDILEALAFLQDQESIEVLREMAATSLTKAAENRDVEELVAIRQRRRAEKVAS